MNNTNPTPGTPMEGGYFVGIINVDGTHYGVIVSPKLPGEPTGKWGEYEKKIPARHVADGLANTKAMAEAGSELAKQTLALDIAGHTDWYIPSRDELELIYRNLKPTEEENYCSFRDGENPSSVPPGQMYEEESPVQTTADAFKGDNQEAMNATWYWSSTQSSATTAFIQDFSDGSQGTSHKVFKGRVRAVRRFLAN